MRLASKEVLVDRPSEALVAVRAEIERTLAEAIRAVVWPPGSSTFTIFGEPGAKRGKGNGVKPIKNEFTSYLAGNGWFPEKVLHFADETKIGRFDAVRPLPGCDFRPYRKNGLKVASGSLAVVEWETGNISSSHRSLNRMALSLIHGGVAAAFLVLPTRKLYRYLTGRIGNLEELAPYFGVYRALDLKTGWLEVLAIEYDEVSDDSAKVPRIPKATDGRALQ